MTNTSREGVETKQYFNAVDQVLRDENAFGGKTDYEYDLAGNLTETTIDVTESANVFDRSTTYEYDGLDRVTEMRQHGSVDLVTENQYNDTDANDWDVIVIDARNNQTKLRYDSLGNLVATRQTGPGGEAVDDPITLYSYHYDASRRAYAVSTRLTSERAEDDLVAHWNDPEMRDFTETRVSRQVINTLGAVLTTAVVSGGLKPSNHSTEPDKASSADLLDGFQLRQNLEYNHAIQVSAIVEPVPGHGAQHKRSTFNYDQHGSGTNQLLRQVEANGETTKYQYDSAGNRLETRQLRRDGQPDNLTTFTYDDLGRVLSEITTVDTQDAGGEVTGEHDVTRSWQYNGLTTTYTNRNEIETVTTFNPAAKTNTATTTDGGLTHTATTTFYSDGSVESIVDSYSGSGSRVGDGSSIEYAYDQYGRRDLTINNGLAGTEFLDDDLPKTTLENTYHATGHRDSDTWKLGTTDILVLTNTYNLDKLNRTERLEQEIAASTSPWTAGARPEDKAIELFYNADGRLQQLNRFDDDALAANLISFSKYRYADEGNVAKLSHHRTAGGSNPLLAEYLDTHDAQGRRETAGQLFNNGAGTEVLDTQVRFHYDAQDQVIGTGPVHDSELVDLQPANTGTQPIDETGNRLRVESTIGRDNRLLQDALYSYKYDDEGRLTLRTEISSGDTYHYEWDHRDLLLSVEKVQQGTGTVLSRVDYGYDALGRQIGKQVTGGESEAYVYDGNDRVFTIDLVTDKIDTSYFRAPGGQVAAVDQAGETIWTLPDLAGTVRSVASESGGTWQVVHREYDPFGLQEPFPSTDNSQELLTGDTGATHLVNAPQFFAGFEWDEDIDLYFIGSRAYDPLHGRWLSDTGAENGYQFRDNNPVRERVIGATETVVGNYDVGILPEIINRGIGEGFRATVGDEYLSRASDAELVTVLAAGLGAGAAAGAAAAAAAYGLGTVATGALVGASSGAAEYLGTTLTASAFNAATGRGGDPGPTLGGLAFSTVGGALTGGVLPLAGAAGGAALRSAGGAARSFVVDTGLPFARSTARLASRIRVESFGIHGGLPIPRRIYLAAVDEALEAGELTIRAGHQQIKRIISLPEVHHLATDKGPLRRQLSEILDQAGLSFDSPFNKVKIPGHQGPHGIFNQIVLRRLQDASRGKVGAELRQAVTDELLDLRYRAKKGDLLDLLKARASKAEVREYQ